MLKKIGMISIFIIVWTTESHACLQTIAIPAEDFCAGNSLIIITQDLNGLEQVSGCVSLDEGKTQYSQEDIYQHHIVLNSIKEHPQAIVLDVQEDESVLNKDGDVLIYLHFEVDSYIVRVLVIKNNLLADNPFDIIEYSTSQLLLGDDDEDDFFGSFDNDNDLMDFDLTDVKVIMPTSLSYYDTAVLGTYVAWIMMEAQAKQSYNEISDWFKSKYAE